MTNQHIQTLTFLRELHTILQIILNTNDITT